MAKLETALEEWVQNKIISPEQAKKIRDHEAARPEYSWVLSGVFALGVSIIGIGVISLIAANWTSIPNFAKIIGDFAILIVLAGITVRASARNKPLQYEAWLLSFLIFVLASIGLISQVYHTGGKLFQALLLWAAITFVPMFASRRFLVPFLWTAAFISSLAYAASESKALEMIFNDNYAAIATTLPLLCITLAAVTHRLSASKSPATAAFRIWALISGLLAVAAAELREFVGYGLDYGMHSYTPAYILMATSVVATLLNRQYRKLQKILLLSAMGSFLIPFHLTGHHSNSSLIYATLTILTLGLAALFLASVKERRLFQWFLFFLGLRFLILYFQAFGGLATTGVGLIIAGSLFIGMAILWNKYRNPIAAWTERWVS